MKKNIKTFLLVLIFGVILLTANTSNASNLETTFDLRNHIDIEVKDQKDTNLCWTFTSTSLLSLHLEYKTGEELDFSPRHIEYATSTNAFSNGTNEHAFEDRVLNEGGYDDIYKRYYVQGIGPILEQNMPFENNVLPIEKEEFSDDLAYKQVTGLAHLPTMKKVIENGDIVSYDNSNQKMTDDEVNSYYNNIKTVIKEYGGVDVSVYYDVNAYNETNSAYYSNEFDTDTIINGLLHSIVLIGWDDNYSKDNFKQGKTPKRDGAFIALNSWGEDYGNNGIFYISYDEPSLHLFIKTYIESIENMDYDFSYLEDLQVAKNNNETLTELSILLDSSLYGTAYANVLVNGQVVLSNVTINSAIENIKFKCPIPLTPTTEVEVIINVPDNIRDKINVYYHTVSANRQFEVGNLIYNTDSFYIYTTSNVIDNGNNVDVKVTKNNTDFTNKFIITGNQIVNSQTGIYIIPNGAETGSYEITLEYNGTTVTKSINVNSSSEIIVLKGDLSGDNRVSIIDLSKMKAYIVGLISLPSQSLKAADMNDSGHISVTDLSRLKMTLVGLI